MDPRVGDRDGELGVVAQVGVGEGDGEELAAEVAPLARGERLHARRALAEGDADAADAADGAGARVAAVVLDPREAVVGADFGDLSVVARASRHAWCAHRAVDAGSALCRGRRRIGGVGEVPRVGRGRGRWLAAGGAGDQRSGEGEGGES